MSSVYIVALSIGLHVHVCFTFLQKPPGERITPPRANPPLDGLGIAAALVLAGLAVGAAVLIGIFISKK